MSEELGAFYLFMCKTWVSAVTGNELSLCRQTEGAEPSEEAEGRKQENQLVNACVGCERAHAKSQG